MFMRPPGRDVDKAVLTVTAIGVRRESIAVFSRLRLKLQF